MEPASILAGFEARPSCCRPAYNRLTTPRRLEPFGPSILAGFEARPIFCRPAYNDLHREQTKSTALILKKKHRQSAHNLVFEIPKPPRDFLHRSYVFRGAPPKQNARFTHNSETFPPSTPLDAGRAVVVDKPACSS